MQIRSPMWEHARKALGPHSASICSRECAKERWAIHKPVCYKRRAVKMGTEAGEELKAKVGGDALEFFGESEVLPEPKSSVTGVETDGVL